ncbi:MAG: MerR family transcriptional regulator [Cyclobacteriaceae bacterium]|jgi:DNA-binding transcriptional MerR regulator
MGKYSIRELEQLSGIKAHTIRIWEKRHNLVNPNRTGTNIRFYSDDDLKKIINVSLLNQHGFKISKIVNLSLDELNRKVAEISTAETDTEIFIDQLILAMIDLEEEKFEGIVTQLSDRFGFERTVLEIIYPFLEKIGVLWQTGNVNPAQEHFISHLIRQKIIAAIDHLPLPPKTNPRIVLFLPESELHEIGLLFFHYVVKKEGFRTYYLGQTVPYEDLKAICAIHMPRYIITQLTSVPPASEVQNFLSTMCRDLPESVILASGYALKKAPITPPTNLRIFHNALMLKNIIAGQKPV